MHFINRRIARFPIRPKLHAFMEILHEQSEFLENARPLELFFTLYMTSGVLFGEISVPPNKTTQHVQVTIIVTRMRTSWDK